MAKWNHSIFSPVVSNPFCYLTVDESNVLIHRKWGRTLIELPLEGSTAQANTKGVAGIVGGYGDITVSREGSSFAFSNIQGASALVEAIKRRQLPAEERELLQEYANAKTGVFWVPVPASVFFLIGILGLIKAPAWGLLIPLLFGVGGFVLWKLQLLPEFKRASQKLNAYYQSQGK